jgi:hypothetical protein
LRSAFGVCGNEISPADGHVVHAEFGCGAHSEVRLEAGSSVPVAELVYDDSLLDMEFVDSGTSEGNTENAEENTESGQNSQDSRQAQDPQVSQDTQAAQDARGPQDTGESRGPAQSSESDATV